MNMMNAVDITRAIARPSNRSRTMATGTTRVAAPAMPPSTRVASSAEKLPEAAQTRLAAAYATSAPVSTGRRPKRSASGPCRSWPTPKPSRKAVMTNCRRFSAATPNA